MSNTYLSSLRASEQSSVEVQRTPNRVSLDAMLNKVRQVEYYNPNVCPHMTVAMVEMDNGFVVLGKSAPADPGNFDEEVGRKFAFEDAMRQVWPLEGYLLREQIQRETDPARGVEVKISINEDRSYMQASVSYPARRDETWRRGKDLPDGKAEPKTIARILSAISETLTQQIKG